MFVTLIVNLAVPSTSIGVCVCGFATTFISRVCTFGVVAIASAGCESEITGPGSVASEPGAATAHTAAAAPTSAANRRGLVETATR